MLHFFITTEQYCIKTNVEPSLLFNNNENKQYLKRFDNRKGLTNKISRINFLFLRLYGDGLFMGGGNLDKKIT